MKKIVMIFAILFLSSNAYASGEWVPYNNPYVVIQGNDQIISLITNQPEPNIRVVYQWTPHIVLEPVITKTRRFFYEKETITMAPVTRWVYQPVIISNP